MSTDVTWQTTTDSVEASLALAASIGSQMKGGELLILISDLGGGKTTFVRGLAQGMGSEDQVSSPSFTINNEYRAGNVTLQHFDFYRLTEPGIMQAELTEFIKDPATVIVIEWADIVANILPENHMTITITASSETGRNFKFEYPEQLAYVMEYTK